MAGVKLWVKIVLSVVCAIQLGLILVNFVIALKDGSSLSYLNLIDLIFPCCALIFIYRFDRDKNKKCSAKLLIVIYLIWCLLWVIIGLVLILVRSGIIMYDETDKVAVALLGPPASKEPQTVAIYINAAQLILQALGFIFGCMALCGKPDKDDGLDAPKKGGNDMFL